MIRNASRSYRQKCEGVCVAAAISRGLVVITLGQVRPHPLITEGLASIVDSALTCAVPAAPASDALERWSRASLDFNFRRQPQLSQVTSTRTHRAPSGDGHAGQFGDDEDACSAVRETGRAADGRKRGRCSIHWMERQAPTVAAGSATHSTEVFMTISNVSALNHAVHQAQEWVKALCAQGPFETEDQAYSALRAVLQELRDHLTVEEAADFAAQLPMLLRGVYYEGWRPSAVPRSERSAQAFFDAVAARMRGAAERVAPQACVPAVLGFLQRQMDPGELRQVQAQLPKQLRELWPSARSE